MTQPIHPMLAKLEAAIEKAARDSLPWPDQEEYLGQDENGEEIYGPRTLGSFVENTYISGDDGSKVFRQAAKAAARAAIQALLEPDEGQIREAGDELYDAGMISGVVTDGIMIRTAYRAMLLPLVEDEGS